MHEITKIISVTLITASTIIVVASAAQAGQYNFCYPVKKSRIIQDPGFHPNAYDDGYREGAETARKKEPYEPRTAGGEFSRGFDDGYYGRTYTTQQNTVPDRREFYTTNQCKTYYYNDKDDINRILDSVLRDVQNDLRRDWNFDNY